MLAVDVPVVEDARSDERLATLADPVTNSVPQLGIVGVDITDETAVLIAGLRSPRASWWPPANQALQGSDSPLTAGDIIHSINGFTVRSLDGLRAILDSFKARSRIVLRSNGNVIFDSSPPESSDPCRDNSRTERRLPHLSTADRVVIADSHPSGANKYHVDRIPRSCSRALPCRNVGPTRIGRWMRSGFGMHSDHGTVDGACRRGAKSRHRRHRDRPRHRLVSGLTVPRFRDSGTMDYASALRIRRGAAWPLSVTVWWTAATACRSGRWAYERRPRASLAIFSRRRSPGMRVRGLYYLFSPLHYRSRRARAGGAINSLWVSVPDLFDALWSALDAMEMAPARPAAR